MQNYLIVTNQPYPRWQSSFAATLAWADTKRDGENWGQAIENNYKHCDALITDLAPVWSDLSGDALPTCYNGLQAVSDARSKSLPAFVYTPYSPEVLVSTCYRAGCLAVVSSALYAIEDFEPIVSECIRTSSLWIDKNSYSESFYNHLLCITDEKLGKLTDQEIALFQLVVTNSSYEDAASACSYKVGTLRNKSSAIFKRCGFKNRSQALNHALKIGLISIV